MYTIREDLQRELDEIRAQGLYKSERIITSPQGADIIVARPGGNGSGPREVINFCANNYLGLGGRQELVDAAKEGLDSHGYGLSSVRFICGTQDIHKVLERRLADFLGMEDAILYIACFDANGGLFESLMGAEDAIVSDALNHASIIDGIRLSKAMRFRYNNTDMDDLRTQLQAAKDANARRIMIATDGVFSMDGHIAPLDKVCELADEFGALVMIDESHSTGFMGRTGRGVHELCGVMDRIDIVTTTLGKALGGACGGATAARREIVEYLRQKSRPYLFSNTVPPAIVSAALKVLEMLSASTELRDRLEVNTARFRQGMEQAGFNIIHGTHPIVPVMLGDAALASRFADELLDEGIYVIGFSYPVVPQGKARIRVQVSAAHTEEHIDRAIAAFTKVGERLGVLGNSVGA
ncbi:glycine C-acetyltransferase [bacterium]|nr:glycine C-acetyltransferase [bacterium]